MHLRETDTVCTVHQFAGRCYTDGLAREREHLELIDKGNGVGKIEVHVWVDGCQISSKLTVGVTFMEQHDLHGLVIRSLQHVAQVQWIAQTPVRVAITIAGVKLYCQSLFCGLAEGNMQEVVQERLVRDT